MIEDLSDDELTVLQIAAQGESIAPIGRWEAPVKKLAFLGYLRRLDDFNYVITPKGHHRADEQEDEDAMAFLRLNNEAVRRKNGDDDGDANDAERLQ